MDGCASATKYTFLNNAANTQGAMTDYDAGKTRPGHRLRAAVELPPPTGNQGMAVQLPSQRTDYDAGKTGRLADGAPTRGTPPPMALLLSAISAGVRDAREAANALQRLPLAFGQLAVEGGGMRTEIGDEADTNLLIDVSAR